MSRRPWAGCAALVLAACALVVAAPAARGQTAIRRASSAAPSAQIVLSGGCYWGVESVFRHVRGISAVVSGFAVPTARTGARTTEPAEAVHITYDPAQLSYNRILELFFSVAHDPTQVNRQGPDVGAEYRSIVFVNGPRERTTARAFVDSLGAAHVFPRPIVTEIAALGSFEAVGASQQDYAAKHPDDPYIVINDAPKIAALRRRFPGVFRK